MTEARAFSLGQYAHNNQPSHHLLFLFSLLEDSPSTQKHVRYVLQRGFGEDFFAGDEDNGEQGAWFVLSALGLYPVTVGLPSYVLTSPIFPHVRVERVINGQRYFMRVIIQTLSSFSLLTISQGKVRISISLRTAQARRRSISTTSSSTGSECRVQ